MKKFNKRTIYIVLFAILYICVGLVSTIHAVSFFALANGIALAVILACAFEVGQAAVLFSILTDIRKRKKVMPWLLMSVLTIVQIMGNIYSSYKYLITNSEANLRFFKEPIFTWVENMPDQNANVLLCYVIGAILPIVSLLMTAMLTSYLENDQQIEEEIEEIEEEEPEDDIEEEKERLEKEHPTWRWPWKFNKYEEKEEPEEDGEKKLVEDDEEDDEELESLDEQEETEETPEEEDKEYYIEPEDEPKEMAREPQEENMQSHTINL